MRDIVERIEEKLDKLHEDVHEIKVDTAKNTVSLDHHIKRTDELQDLYVDLKTGVCAKVDVLEKDNVRVKMVWKVVVGIGVLVGIVSSLVRVL